MWHRRFARACVLVLALVGVPVAASPAHAAAPDQQGWWTSTNPGGLPADASAGSGVPPDGLLVQAGPASPSAYAALVYLLVQSEQPRQLVLKVAPDAATTPGAALVLCPLTSSSFDARQGGAMSQAPPYDCTRQVTARADDAGTTFTADIGGLLVDGAVAIALVPGNSTSRIVLSKPDSSSLETTSATASPQAGGGEPGEPLPLTPQPGSEGGAPVSLPPLSGSPAVSPAPSPQTPVVLPSSTQSPQPQVVGQANATSSLAGQAERTAPVHRAVLALLVLGTAVAGVLWAFAGSYRSPES